jgi:predicted dehydrogenase
MIGFNYVRTPATQFARQLLAEGAIGDVTWFRGEHTEDFLADPETPANWRTTGRANGTMGDLAPAHDQLRARADGPDRRGHGPDRDGARHAPRARRPGAVDNDDHAQMMCRFESGAMGHLYFSRIATGRKMGYAYEITAPRARSASIRRIRTPLALPRRGAGGARGFTKILTGPAHPDYLPFCQGPGHGTGYQDQIIIEARDFLRAIETGAPVWPTFRDGLEVAQVIDTALRLGNEEAAGTPSQD